jgi:glycosyltransferase involved in cell wall biosynthesis
MASVGMVTFRLGTGDGVSVEVAKWADALRSLGHAVTTVAGAGRADVVLPGLGLPGDDGRPPDPPDRAEVESALAPFDLVVVENLCSLPLNPAAADAVASVLRGRPAVLHHHDLPWQRPHLAHHPPPLDDPVWRHVTINELSRHQLARHDIIATTVYNHFDCEPGPGDRARVRGIAGLDEATTLVLQPTRALARKNVAAGIALAESLGATFWLLGVAEDGYGPALEALVERATCDVVLGSGDGAITAADAYAACDVVALPSSWEGFGNPTVESAIHRRPLAVGPYPVARELAGFGFEWYWFGGEDGLQVPTAQLAGFLERPRRRLLEHNHDLARRHFDLRDLPACLEAVLAGMHLPTR